MRYIYAMEYHSAIERNETASLIETCRNLESVVRNELSQKEKNNLLMHVCEIYKNGIMFRDSIHEAEIETQMQRTNVWIPRGEGKRGWEKLRSWN